MSFSLRQHSGQTTFTRGTGPATKATGISFTGFPYVRVCQKQTGSDGQAKLIPISEDRLRIVTLLDGLK